MFIGKAISNLSIPCKWQQSNDTKNCMGNKDFKTIRGPKIYLKTEDMLYSGCNGTGLSFYIKYADESTDEEPVVIAKGVDENGNDFEQRIFINKINPSCATVVEMRALEGHHKVKKQGGLTSLPLSSGELGLNDRANFISMFEQCIGDMKKLGRYDLSLLWMKSMDTYLSLTKNKYGQQEKFGLQ